MTPATRTAATSRIPAHVRQDGRPRFPSLRISIEAALLLAILLGSTLFPACGSGDGSGTAPAPIPGPAPNPPMPAGERVQVRVSPWETVGVLGERYLGYALDTAQITNGLWWSPDPDRPAIAETPDLESPKLRRLASQLAPSRLRIGGTACDGVYFCPEEGACELPPSFRDVYRGEDHIPTVLTHDKLRRVADFAEAAGATVMFCIAMGPGPRDPATGAWTADNARELIRHARSLPNRDVFEIWEPGNEVNFLDITMQMPVPLRPERYAEDLGAFRAMVDEEDPGADVVAPGSYFLPFPILGDLGFTREVAAAALNRVDRLSWHLYATQSDRCPVAPFPATLEGLFAPAVVENTRAMARYVREAAGALVPVMNGESASSQCGGQHGLSDTMADALWYADWIGIMAEEGTSALVRQTLVGADYGMLDMGTFDPRPSFLASVLYRRTVERFRLATRADRTRIKAHGYCAAGRRGAVTVVLVNPTEQGRVAEIDVQLAITGAVQWTLDTGGDVSSRHATINSRAPLDDGTIPSPAGEPVHRAGGRAFARVDPYAVTFVLLTLEADAPVCR